MPYNVNLENLTELHGKDKGYDALREIAELGGYGTVGTGEGQISPTYAGGLDVQGVLDPNNTAVSTQAKDRIAELAGVNRKDSDNYKTTSSAHKKS